MLKALSLGFASNPRKLRKAQDVARVFKLYASRLRERSAAESELTNTLGDLVLQIWKRAETARLCLYRFDESDCLELDRAYANGAQIDEYLEKLLGSLNEASMKKARLSRRSLATGSTSEQLAIREASQLLSAVASLSQSLIPEVGDPRNLRQVHDVTRVSKLYAARLRWRSIAQSELTNKQGDLVHGITESAENARRSLDLFSENASGALDRASVNGATVEKYV